MDSKTNYWKWSVKEHRVYICDSRPKGKSSFVEETWIKIDFDTLHHVFVLYNEGIKTTVSKQMISRCGYDRGPKRNVLIAEMLGHY